MWLVVELRRGDIAQTWAMTFSKDAAYRQMQEFMDNLHDDSTSWWKVVWVEDQVIHQPIGGKTYYVGIKVNWEDDNKFEFVRIFDGASNIPASVRNDENVWVDMVRYNPN